MSAGPTVPPPAPSAPSSGSHTPFLVAAGCVALTVMIYLAWLGKAARDSEAAARNALPAAVRNATPDTPAGPLLLTDEPAALREYLDAQRRKLSTYEWVGADKSAARIPIERAMALALEKQIFPAAEK